ncbi:MAG: stage III sporulation protein AF [Bacillota bacterium]|nr:stage III sporulation protein AF [Bacillota bacterium]
MTDMLKDWVRDIFIIVTALCFTETVLPKGGMRKYLKFIFSLIILGVVISPAVYLTDGAGLKDEITGTYGEYSMYTETLAKADSEPEDAGGSLEEVQNIQIKEIYRQKIVYETERAVSEYYPEVKIEGVEVYLGEPLHGDKKELSYVSKIVIKGEDCEYVSNIVRCVSQRLGIEDSLISYKGAGGDGSYE